MAVRTFWDTGVSTGAKLSANPLVLVVALLVVRVKPRRTLGTRWRALFIEHGSVDRNVLVVNRPACPRPPFVLEQLMIKPVMTLPGLINFLVTLGRRVRAAVAIP